MCETAPRKSQREALPCGFDGSLTCSAAACWTVWAGKPLASGTSRCSLSCRRDFAAPARSACSPAAPPSASSAPAPAWNTAFFLGHRFHCHATPPPTQLNYLWLTCSSVRRGNSEPLRYSCLSRPGWGWLFWSWISASSQFSLQAVRGCLCCLGGLLARSF